MMMTSRIVAVVGLASLALGAGSCGGGGKRGKQTLPSEWQEQRTVTCAGKPRQVLMCPKVFRVDVAETAKKKSFFDFASPVATEVEAVSRLNAAVTAYSIDANQLCEQYNSCILDGEGFLSRSDDSRKRLGRAFEVKPMLEQAARSGDPLARKKSLHAAYSALVTGAGDEALTVQFDVEAQLPADPASLLESAACKSLPALGGQRVLLPGEAVPTGTRVGFRVLLNRQAHLYLLQRNEQTGEITVLFPDARIATQNPLAANQALRIPDVGQNFCLNDKDIGVERVVVVASLEPLTELVQALGNVSDVTSEGAAPLRQLTQITLTRTDGAGECRTRALELVQDAPTTCTRSRGLVLEGSSQAGAARSSFIATTEAADSVIAKAFPFEHMTLGDYRGRNAMPGAALMSSRGIILEE